MPLEVHRELQRSGTPFTVRKWASSLPAWCEVRTLSSSPDPTLSEHVMSVDFPIAGGSPRTRSGCHYQVASLVHRLS